MKKVFLIFILLYSYLFNIQVKFVPINNNYDWNYVYSYAIIRNSDDIACRISDLIVDYAYKNKLDVEILTRKNWKESQFKRKAVSYLYKLQTNIITNVVSNRKIIRTNRITNKVPVGYGLGQINLSQHDVRLYYVLNKKYAKRLHQDPNFKYQMIFFIEVNIALGTEILREELDRFNNNYSLALTAYWAGPNSSQLKLLRYSNVCNHYINDILDKEGYEEEMRKFNNWKFINKKKDNYVMEIIKGEKNAL